MKKSLVLIAVILFLPLVLLCQLTKKVLFLGNSYTAANGLPQIVADIAHSMTDTLVFDMNTPGGYTLQGHSINSISLNKIKAGGWDYVLLQEQSQLPSFPAGQVETQVFPYAHFLDSMINEYNHCCETMFYMTWGRKNGDASNCVTWPPVCTYAGMDSILYSNYMAMTYNNNATVSPVGQVWKYIRQHYPSIELYQSDQSHPSAAGSYAAACCFYTAMFRKDPSGISYNFSLTPADAGNIRDAVKNVVYDSLLKWQIGKYDPTASFSYSIPANREVHFNNLSNNAGSFLWDFDDNSTSTDHDPVHIYNLDGNFNVKLTAYNACNVDDTTSLQIVIGDQGDHIAFYPNPVNDYLYIRLQSDDLRGISIFNCLGQKLNTEYSIEGNKIRIDMTMFSKGSYFVSVFTNGRRIIQKIMKK